MKTYSIGEKITVQQWSGEILTGTVIGTGIEEGRSVVDYRLEDGTDKWCYIYQIIEA